MAHKYVADDLGTFVVDAGQADLTVQPRALLKRNVLDSIACAVGSLDGELIAPIREQTEQFSYARLTQRIITRLKQAKIAVIERRQQTGQRIGINIALVEHRLSQRFQPFRQFVGVDLARLRPAPGCSNGRTCCTS